MTTSALDIYEFFLKAADLDGKTVTVQIAATQVRDTFNPTTKKKENKLTLALVGKKKKIMLNKTQVAALIDITGTEDYSQWRGYITLSPAKAQSGKDTIAIGPAKQADIPPRRDPAKVIAELTGAPVQPTPDPAQV